MSYTQDQERKLRRLEWQADQRRLATIKVPHLEFLPDKELLLLAYNEYHTSGAVYNRKQGQWTCRFAGPHLQFLLKKTPNEAKFALAQRGYEWEWRTPKSESVAGVQIPTEQEGLTGLQTHARSTKVQDQLEPRGSASNPATAALPH